MAELLKLVDEGNISGKQAKDVYRAVDRNGSGACGRRRRARDASRSATPRRSRRRVARWWLKIQDKPSSFGLGKLALMGFFVGQVMKETKGAANPQMVNDTLRRLLGVE